jgi:hypothetical protein
MPRDRLSTPDPHAELQPLQSIEPSHPLAIHEPAFASSEHPDPQRPKPRAGMSQIANANPQRRLIVRAASSVPGGPTELGEATGPQATDLKRPVKPGGPFSTACGP